MRKGQSAPHAITQEVPLASTGYTVSLRSVPRSQHMRQISARRLVITAIVFGILGLTLAVPIRTYLSGQDQTKTIKQQNKMLSEQIAAMRKQRALQSNSAWVEQQARERLQYVKPGERAYVVQLPHAPKPTPDQAKEAERAAKPWYTDLWQSISIPR